MTYQTSSFAVTETSQVGEARREAMGIALELGFDETARGRVGIVATEIGNNIVKHAGEGEMLLRPIDCARGKGVEVIGLDRGLGIPDIERSLSDGYSTAGTPGTGLGAIRRQSNLFDIYSVPKKGVCLVSRMFPDDNPVSSTGSFTEYGAICVPFKGETVCGDAWSVIAEASRCAVMVADGLGHGPLAAEASEEAVRAFQARAAGSPSDFLSRAHGALRSTRGAAVAAAVLEKTAMQVLFAGVGNISGSIVSTGESRSLLSHNGTIGHQVRKIQEFVYPWSHSALLILHSDGIATQWDLRLYPGLSLKHPSVIAGVLYRDFKRGKDDATVVVVRESTE